MSFFGRFSDLITGQPPGTTDASAAMGAAADAKLKELDQQQLDSGAITQDQYNQEIANLGDQAYTDSPAEIVGAEIGAGVSTVPDSLLSPVQTFETGLNWEASTAGSVAGGAVAAAAGASKGLLGSFLSKIPWWIYPVGIIALFLYLGGGTFLERKARAKLST